jgi:hypothetical protein
MMQKIRNLVLALTIALLGGLVLTPALANADFKDDACQGVNTLNGNSGTSCSSTAEGSLNKIIRTVIQIFSVVVGFISVIMIIVGGLKMITANGDSGAISSARSTIAYALIGLVVVAMAQVLVHFVLFKTAKAIR